MIYVRTQKKFITGLNPNFILNGFFVVENVGILFLLIMIIPMAVQESPNDKLSINLLTKINEIIINLEFFKITLDKALTINDDF